MLAVFVFGIATGLVLASLVARFAEDWNRGRE